MPDQNNLFPESVDTNQKSNGYIPRAENASVKLDKLAQMAQTMGDFNTTPNPQPTIIQPQYTQNQVYPLQNSYQQVPQPNYNTQVYPNQQPPQNYQSQSNYQYQQPTPQNQQQYQPQPVNYQNYNYSMPSDFNTGIVDPLAPAPVVVKKPKFNFDSKKILSNFWKIGLAVILVGVIVLGGFFAYTKFTTKVSDTSKFLNVTTVINAPKSLSQGTPGTWNVTVTNNEATSLDGVELELSSMIIFNL